MKGKIGLITFYKDNFGSILQCYSTKTILERAGYKCDVLYEINIKQKKERIWISKLKRIWFLIVNFISSPLFYIHWKQAHKMPLPLTEETKAKMNLFVEKYISPKGFTWKEIIEIEKTYDAFIVGSDQIWNAYNDISPIYFLKFTSDYKKIAFAISFGVDKPSFKFLNTIKYGIKGFSKISVREKSGKNIIQKVSNIPVERVTDPTIMITKHEWEEFCSNIPIPQEEYILVHFLNYPSKIAVQYIENLKRNNKVLCIAYKYNIFKKLGWDYVDCGPKEYVAYIKNAKCVCTDSFHTTLFSINLETDFFTFDRQYLHGHPQTDRILDVLERYDLLDRFITDSHQKSNTIKDYRFTIKKERAYIKKYLFNEIQKRERII